MGIACFNVFSDGCMVGEFNEIPWQRMGDKDHHDLNPGRRLAGLDDGLIRFCALPVLACTWLLKIFVAYSLPLERPDNTVAFPSTSWMVVGRD